MSRCACDPISAEAAAVELDGVPLVPALSGSLADIKRMRDRCLAEGIPAVAAAPAPGRG